MYRCEASSIFYCSFCNKVTFVRDTLELAYLRHLPEDDYFIPYLGYNVASELTNSIDFFLQPLTARIPFIRIGNGHKSWYASISRNNVCQRKRNHPSANNEKTLLILFGGKGVTFPEQTTNRDRYRISMSVHRIRICQTDIHMKFSFIPLTWLSTYAVKKSKNRCNIPAAPITGTKLLSLVTWQCGSSSCRLGWGYFNVKIVISFEPRISWPIFFLRWSAQPKTERPIHRLWFISISFFPPSSSFFFLRGSSDSIWANSFLQHTQISCAIAWSSQKNDQSIITTIIIKAKFPLTLIILFVFYCFSPMRTLWLIDSAAKSIAIVINNSVRDKLNKFTKPKLNS